MQIMDPARLNHTTGQQAISSSRLLPAEKAAEPVEEFISSDMQQMLDDIKRNYPLYLNQSPAIEANEKAAKPLAGKPFISHDMARRLEDIARYGESVSAKSTPVEDKAPQGDASPVAHHQGAHTVAADLLTGAHLAIEGAESGGLLGHAVNDLHEAVHQDSESLYQLGEALLHTSHAVAEEAAVPTGKMAAHEGAVLWGSITPAIASGVMISGVVAAGMFGLGMHSLKDGIREQDTEKKIEGTGELILGSKSLASAVTLAAEGAKSGALATIASGAHILLMPLGLAHGAVDLLLGGRKINKGRKHHRPGDIAVGVLEMFQGASIAAAALGGGLPAVTLAIACLSGKVIVRGLVEKSRSALQQEHPPA